MSFFASVEIVAQHGLESKDHLLATMLLSIDASMPCTARSKGCSIGRTNRSDQSSVSPNATNNGSLQSRGQQHAYAPACH